MSLQCALSRIENILVDEGHYMVRHGQYEMMCKVTAGHPACSVSACHCVSMSGTGAALMLDNAKSCDCVSA